MKGIFTIIFLLTTFIAKGSEPHSEWWLRYASGHVYKEPDPGLRKNYSLLAKHHFDYYANDVKNMKKFIQETIIAKQPNKENLLALISFIADFSFIPLVDWTTRDCQDGRILTLTENEKRNIADFLASEYRKIANEFLITKEIPEIEKRALEDLINSRIDADEIFSRGTVDIDALIASL